MTDIVERLRNHTEGNDMVTHEVVNDAADEIERLRAEIASANRIANAGNAWLLLQCGRLLQAGDALHDAIRSHNLEERHLRDWEEARRG